MFWIYLYFHPRLLWHSPGWGHRLDGKLELCLLRFHDFCWVFLFVHHAVSNSMLRVSKKCLYGYFPICIHSRYFDAVLRIVNRILIPMFLGHPDPLIWGSDPDSSIIKQNSKKNLDSYCFVTSLWLFIFEKWWRDKGGLCKTLLVLSYGQRFLNRRFCMCSVSNEHCKDFTCCWNVKLSDCSIQLIKSLVFGNCFVQLIKSLVFGNCFVQLIKSLVFGNCFVQLIKSLVFGNGVKEAVFERWLQPFTFSSKVSQFCKYWSQRKAVRCVCMNRYITSTVPYLQCCRLATFWCRSGSRSCVN